MEPMALQMDEAAFLQVCAKHGLFEPLIDYIAQKHVLEHDDYALRSTKNISAEELKERDKAQIKNTYSTESIKKRLGPALELLKESDAAKEIVPLLLNNSLRKKMHTNSIDIIEELHTKELKDLLEISPRLFSDAHEYAFRFLEVSDTDRASPLYELLTLLSPSNAQLWLEKGIANCLANRWTDGEQDLFLAHQLAPKSPLPLLHLIHASIAQGDHDKADTYYEACKELVQQNDDLKHKWRQKLVELKNIIKKKL